MVFPERSGRSSAVHGVVLGIGTSSRWSIRETFAL